tara:strand:+ start:4723 stop:4962 length:240 start_codon:yes stop_codon:yes gene_type:complete
MATLIKSDGTKELNVDISTLSQMQKMVGGMIEFVYLRDGNMLIVNEEGLLNNLPQNEQASEIYGHPLVGDVVHCGREEV